MAEAALLRSTPLELVPTGAPAPATPPGGPAAAEDLPQVTLRAVPDPPAPTPRLEIPDYDLSAALALRRALGVSHVLAQVLVRRGLADPGAARAFLDPQESHPPSAFAGIDRAVGVIERHIGRGSRIVVHGDYDVDGVCATAIMIRALRTRGADVGWYLPDRITDGYGLSLGTVQRLAERGTGLLVTVDCAITAVEEVAAARAAGLDVVVCDHHAPRADGRLPEAEIVHPGVCGYPCPELCGTGVAYKVAQALGAPNLEDELELVALATVADLMPLTGENRRLVRHGLRALARTSRPGLRALMSASGVDPSALDTHALAFRLAPRINAAGRLRRADAGLELLLTHDEVRAAQIASELERVNAERRAVEQRIVWEAEAQAADQVAEHGERRSFVLAGEGWHPGVVGIVASRVVERHHRPVVVIGLDGDVGSGSARSIPGFDLLAALTASAEHLERYGGHRAAAGLTIRRERLEAFRAAFERHAGEVLTPDLLVPRERVDAIASGCDLGLQLAEELERLEPCGMGNPRPRLLVPGARLRDLRPMGEGRHLRFSVGSGGISARAVAFGCGGRLGVEADEPVDATFRLERNFWNGAVEPRLVLGHARPCGPETIELVGEPDDYLAEVLAETTRDPSAPGPVVARTRNVVDHRGHSPLAVLRDAGTAGGAVLAVCADAPRRLAGLGSRAGGFALISYHALELDPLLAERFPQLVALDPPAIPSAGALLDAGHGFTHLAWGEPELRFAQQMHELEYGLRASLVTLYRSLRLRGRVTGEELEHLLRGDGPHGRPARLAARLIQVLAELGLVSLDRDLPALEIAGDGPTELERSPAYRAYAQRYEDGRRFLSSANQLRGG
ncbi:MAG: single-stranded-DNA-specific exonuclease RecJ [Solirubrobacterales bacterium]|nr:single-stranded-DNA-specific exonuclease RecJ [Solirubrobacterales bacterium]